MKDLKTQNLRSQNATTHGKKKEIYSEVLMEMYKRDALWQSYIDEFYFKPLDEFRKMFKSMGIDSDH